GLCRTSASSIAHNIRQYMSYKIDRRWCRFGMVTITNPSCPSLPVPKFQLRPQFGTLERLNRDKSAAKHIGGTNVLAITSTFMIEVPRHIGQDTRGEVGSRLAAKVPSSRNSPCWQMSAIVHDQPVAFQHRRISRVLIELAQRWIFETVRLNRSGHWPRPSSRSERDKQVRSRVHTY